MVRLTTSSLSSAHTNVSASSFSSSSSFDYPSSAPLDPLGPMCIVYTLFSCFQPAVFEKLYLYKITYSTGRRNNVAKVSSKVEVMAAEEDLLTDDIYGSYLPHKGNRMKLHHWDGKVSGGGVCMWEE